MVLRRHRGILQAVFVLIVISIIGRYFYKYHQETSMKLKAANIRHHELLEERNRFNRELEVMTQSKTDLEYSLKLKSLELTKFRNECQSSKNDLENQLNSEKSKSMTRFSSLESEHRMLKANKEDLETDHKHLKRNFERLKTDHGIIESTYKKNFQDQKEKNEKIITALQNQVEYYQKQENALSIEVNELKANGLKYQNTLKELKEQIAKENAARKIEQEKQSRNKHIVDTPINNNGLYANTRKKPRRSVEKQSQQTGGMLNNIKEDKRANGEGDANNSFEFQKFGRRDTERKNGEPRGELKQNKADSDVLIDAVAGDDSMDRKEAAKPHENDETQKYNLKQDAEEGYKKQEEWKHDIKDEVGDGENQLADNGGQGLVLNPNKKRALANGEDDQLKIEMDGVNRSNDQLNNDQKFDDQDVALQEGEENEDNAAEGEDKNEMMNNEHLLLDKTRQRI